MRRNVRGGSGDLSSKTAPAEGPGLGPSPSPSLGREGVSPQRQFLLQPPTLSLPKGGGAIQGIGEKFTANPVTGTGSMSVPIATSPGRGGFGPQLSLAYDSGAGQGAFGLGWSLSLPSITRKTDRGLPRYLDEPDSDTFILAGAEDLVPKLDAAGRRPLAQTLTVYGKTYLVRGYYPRIEGLFARIECWRAQDDPADVFWRTISADNVTSWFGRTPQSRVFDPEDPRRIFQWMLCETYDDKGNVAVYHYKPEDDAGVERTQVFEANRPARPGQRHAATYLSRITYGNRTPYLPTLAEGPAGWQAPPSAPSEWLLEVRFDYGEYPMAEGPLHPEPIPAVTARWSVRSDPFSTHRPGFEVRTWRLCRRVLMIHRFPDASGASPELLVKSTDFDYDEPSAASLDDPREPGYTVLREVRYRSYQRLAEQRGAVTGYAWRELPPLTFEYSKPRVDTTMRRLAARDLPNLPVGTQGAGYQWVDLDGEGLSGVLSEQGGAWHYAPNRGGGRFGPSRVVAQVAATAALAAGRQQLMDLAGDGEIDLVDFGGPAPGFHERDRDEGWKRHVPFASLPNIDWQDPNLRFVDLTGDGHADALITEHEVFTWYPSLEERGFGPALRSRPGADEDTGPRLVFDDGTQSIFLADMCGDGLTDLVRIRNGEVCYWPNLGYGRFGRKVTLANAPRFDAPDLFDPRRLRLADIDGSGPVDLIYLGRDGARLYFNRSGNGLSHALPVPFPVATENLGAVQVADLLGNGTACLVWSSHLPADAAHPVRYMDLMGGGKPHLLTAVDNHRGGRTEIDYTPSTAFYLQDLAASRPWVTRLPFPVHCVSKVTTKDQWRKTTFTTHYSYHHGHFDGVEREFRGFGRVEQWDTAAFHGVQLAHTGTAHVTQDHTLYQPPVKTVTWFHTGAAQGRQRILGGFAHEYFTAIHAAAFRQAGFGEPPLPEPEIDLGTGPALDADEWRQAMRACKGMPLRQEVYELDAQALEEGRHVPVRLFTATQHRCHIRRLQPRGSQRHAVFLALESETTTCHYELDLRPEAGSLADRIDPRVAHTLNLRFDEYGRVQQSVAVVYPRHRPHTDDRQTTETRDRIRAVQAERHIAYTETRFTAKLDVVHQRLHHRLPLPYEVLSYELTGSDANSGFVPSRGRHFAPEDFRKFRLSDSLRDQGESEVASLAYHQHTDSGAAHKRLVEHVITQYWDDASATAPPSVPLPIGRHGPRGLKYQDYKLALTDGLLAAVFGGGNADTLPADRLAWEVEPGRTGRDLLNDPAISGYVRGSALDRSGDGYWLRSGTAGFADDAHQHFFLPERFTDAFGQNTTLEYDPLDWYVASSTDAKGNRTAVLAYDFRVLAPTRLRDANHNVSEVAFDILGLPVASAVLGKVRFHPDGTLAGSESGDRLDELSFAQLNPSPGETARFFGLTDPTAAFDANQARDWLGKATARFVYHFGETRDAQGNVQWAAAPAGACAIARERHERDLPNTGSSQPIPIQVAFEYSDGAGQAFVRNLQAEPEAPGGPLRWLTNGLTVLNNKGKPVLQYERYFSGSGLRFAEPEAHGVSPVMHYDAPGRLVRTDLPDGTVSRVVFSPWHIETWDAGDTVLESEWYRRRNALDPSDPLTRGLDGLVTADPEQRAGWLAACHANTPAQVHLDSLGREVVSIAHNRVKDTAGTHEFGGARWRDDFYVTYTRLDAEGKPLWIRDARGNLVMQYVTPAKPTRWQDQPHERLPAGSTPCYDIAGNLLHQHSMDAGDRWMLHDAAGQPLLAWDFNERQDDGGAWWQEQRLHRTECDALRRPTAHWLGVWRRRRAQPGATPEPFERQPPVMIERFEYQDGAATDPANLNGQLVRHYDASGLVQTVRRDLNGQIQEVRRRLAADPARSHVDWQTAPTANDARLESDTYIQLSEHDALGRLTRLYNWHRDVTFGPGDAEQPTPGTTNRVAVYEPEYNERGLLKAERLHVRARKTTDAQGRVSFTPHAARSARAVDAITYNARGQKLSLALGNGTVTRYAYDPANFRLVRLYTRRGAGHPGDCASDPDAPEPARPCGVQNLRYTCDPVGNITHIRDDAQQTVYFRNRVVEPSCDYTYDALYRLTEASGREQAGMTGAPRIPEGPWRTGPIPTDDTLRRYTQRYVYDAVGNFERMEHRADGGSWTRYYATAEDNNRLLRTWQGDPDWDSGNATNRATYGYDPHGSMLNLGATPEEFNLHWDHRDMIRHIHLGGGGEVWYQYDSGKQRTRKLIQRNGATTEERLYLGGFERYRRTRNGQLVEEIESHHLFAGDERVLLVDDVLLAEGQRGPVGISLFERTCWRYQYGNHLASVGLELDDAARLISYEEFHPYGTSAYRLMNSDSAVRAPAKRYRYTGMERDEESGSACHEARYYSAWLARWQSCDPTGLSGGLNIYQYAGLNPTLVTDTNGLQAKKSTAQYRKEAQFFYSQGWMEEYREYTALAQKAGVEEGLTKAATLRQENSKATTMLLFTSIAAPAVIAGAMEVGAPAVGALGPMLRVRALVMAFRVIQPITSSAPITTSSISGGIEVLAGGAPAVMTSALTTAAGTSSTAAVASITPTTAVGAVATIVAVGTSATLVPNTDPLGLKRNVSGQPSIAERTVDESNTPNSQHSLAQLDEAALTALFVGHQLTHGRGTITVQVVRDSNGRTFIFGVVTGRDPGLGGVAVPGWEIASDLEAMVEEELGFDAEFYSGAQQADLHAERVHQQLLEAFGYTQMGPAYTNRAPCSSGCAQAQSSINATIVPIRPTP